MPTATDPRPQFVTGDGIATDTIHVGGSRVREISAPLAYYGPDLLAACEDIVARAPTIRPQYDGDPEMHGRVLEAYETARKLRPIIRAIREAGG